MFWKTSPRAHLSILTGPEQDKVKIADVDKVIKEYERISISFKIQDQVKIFPKGKREFAVLAVTSLKLDIVQKKLNARKNGQAGVS